MPRVQWDVFFSEVPGHSDGAGGTELLPKDMIADLTPETLIDWLSKEWGEFCNMKQLITDELKMVTGGLKENDPDLMKPSKTL